jgi:phage baseplate assembly protein W
MPVSASFPLIPEPSAAASVGASQGSAELSAYDVTQGFLGFGLLRPFRRDLKADFAADGGERIVRSAVGQVLGTMAGSDFTQGEVPWRTEFGSLLHLLRHKRNDSVLQELARVYVVDALKRWEPRVAVTSVQMTREQQDGQNVLAIRIRYNLVDRASGAVLLQDLDQTVLA